jgi:hypothetical protein
MMFLTIYDLPTVIIPLVKVELLTLVQAERPPELEVDTDIDFGLGRVCQSP